MQNEFLLYLVRHGESANNALPEEQRVDDPALTELGAIQADKLGERFRDHVAAGNRLDKILSSPFRRTIQTSRPMVTHLAMQPSIWTDLYEVGGCFSGHQEGELTGRPGMTRSELRAEFPEYALPDDIDENGWYKCRPFERYPRAVKRAESLAARIKTEFCGEDIVVLCAIHADLKNLLMAQFCPHDREYAQTICSNTSVSLLKFTETSQPPVVLMFNDVSHLARDEITP